MQKIELNLPNEQATINLAKKLAILLKKGDFVSLNGELGAGKSTLARAIIRFLAEDNNLDVPSPSFALVQEYNITSILNIYHCDFYRLHNPQEVLELDVGILAQSFKENNAIYLVEWAAKAGSLLRVPDIIITLKESNDGRLVTIEGNENIVSKI